MENDVDARVEDSSDPKDINDDIDTDRLWNALLSRLARARAQDLNQVYEPPQPTPTAQATSEDFPHTLIRPI